MIIYKTTCLVNNKIYIGQSYKNDPNYFGSGRIFLKAIKKHGKSNFKKEILEYCNDIDHLNERERYWIKFFNSTDLKIGYNVRGGGLNSPQSEITKEKLRGRVVTDECKRKISEKNKGRKHSLETREKYRQRSLGNKNSLGYRHTEEAKKKMSEKHIGMPPGNKGIPHSEETKRKMREAREKYKKKVYIYDLDGNFLMESDSYRGVLALIGVHKASVRSCILGLQKSCKGFVFRSEKF